MRRGIPLFCKAETLPIILRKQASRVDDRRGVIYNSQYIFLEYVSGRLQLTEGKYTEKGGRKMSEFRKLFRAKRILAMILAVAMTVTSIPVTANAAPLQTQAEAGLTAEEAEGGQMSDDQTVPSDGEGQAGEPSESQGAGEDSGMGDQSDTEDSTDAGDNTDAGNASGTGETNDGADPSDTEDDSGADDDASAEVNNSEEENGGDKDIAADGENSNSSATAEMVVDYTGIGNQINNNYSEYRYDMETKTIVAEYSKDSSNPFEDIAGDIKDRYINVYLDHNENATLKEHLHYAWVDSAGNSLNGAGPADAGDYRLRITLPTVAGVYDKEEIICEINFRIDRRDVGIMYNGSTSVVPGTLAGAVKEAVKQSYTLSIEGMLLSADNKEAYLQSDEVVIRDVHSNSALNDSDQLLKTKDYAVELTIVLKEEYAKNYNITDCIANIDMDGIIATEIMVQNEVNQDGTDFGKVYDAKCIDEEAVKKLIGETVVIEAESGEIIPDAKITYTWFDANRTELENHGKVIDAGTYYFVLAYAGREGLYQAADKEIMVVISTADIAIEPVLMTGVTFYAGMTVKDVLQKAVDTYKVYQIDNKGDMTAAVKADPYFWGISYNDAGKTQSYEPVFAVEEGVVIKGDDGTETISWNVLDNNSAVLVKKDDVKYRIVFSGKKAVYNSNGAEQAVDVNASQQNYRVDLSKETLEQYAKEITVTGCDPADIDVSAMYKPAFCTNPDAEAGNRFDNAIRRDYNGTQLFTKRNEYKLAKVKSSNTLLAENTDTRIKYTWQRFTGEYNYFYQDEEGKFVDENGEAIEAGDRYIAGTDQTGSSVLIEPLYDDYYYYGYDSDVEFTSTPGGTGDYRLEVSFADPQKQYYADSRYVYYTIQKKNVQVQLTGTLEEYEGVSVGDFINKIEYTYEADGTRSYVKHRIVGGTVVTGPDGTYIFTPDANGQSSGLSERDHYTLDWYVERQIKEGADAGTYIRLADGDVFLKGETYRLGVELSGAYDDSYFETNYNNRYALDEHSARKTDADGNYIIAYENEVLDIAVNESEGIRLNVEVDWSKVSDTAKVYDGKSFSFTDTGIRDAVIFTNPKDGSIVDDAQFTLQWFYQYRYDGRYVDENNAVHVGDYYLYVIVNQDAKYARASYLFNQESDKKFTIAPRELTVTPVLKEEIKAGTYINSSSADVVGKLCAADPKITGYENISADRKFFEENKIYMTGSIFRPHVFNYLSLSVYEKADRNRFMGYLRSTKSYNVSYTGTLRDIYDDNDGGQIFWARDYQVVFETAAFTPVRDTSSVESTAANNIAQTRLHDSISGDAKGGYTHTITPREGVVYSPAGYYEDENGERKALKGNYFVFRITAPNEYIGVADAADNVVYENSIQDKGYLLSVGVDRNRAVYTVAFDASRKDRKRFEIIWENGYKENFVVDFTNCILMDDLSRAVAPKQLAFNGAVSKMVVGESQQLDLKITKKQMSDVICILYESSDESVLEVSERGCVTAVKKGQATITAYPAYEAEGKKKKLTDAKGNILKGASLKITVNELAAVKAIKTEPHDTYAYLNYTVPAGGYRREIYVLKSSKTDKKTAQDFEEEIGKITNGNYGAFVTKPIYCTGETGAWISKGVTYYHRITNLEPNQQYTVYVRNVGALRTTADGYKTESTPAGAVSTFTTTRAQEVGLRAYFDTEKTAVENEGSGYYVNISARKVPLSVDARFLEKYDEDKDYSDALDYIWRQLSLTKEEQETYINPKLTYYVTDNVYEEVNQDDKTQLRIGGYVFRPVSKIAAVDKKGNISLKGVGLVYVLAYNADTQHIAVASLNITADADGLTGKNIKLKVGNKVRLTDYLTYKQKSTKLTGYCESGWQDLVINYVPNDSYELTLQKDGYGVIKECWITARKADKAKFEIYVNDNTVMKNGGSAAKIVVTSAEIEPVKKLKAQDIVDTFGSVTFTYTANNDFKTEKDGDKLAFRIEVKDSTGRMMRRELINEAYIREQGKYEGYADAKHTTYQYRYRVNGLTRLSNYTVSVYAVYGDDQSKAAATKLKTTNIPASYVDVSDQNVIEGGVETNVSVRDDSIIALSDHPLLKSGNKYTLSLPLDDADVNRDAALMKTDTLTWKSSNTKAATVKSNAGSFTAALTAVKKGTTTISVTSKVTKKVIAKWVVIVNAVGEAEGYYGDNVQFDYDYNDQGNLDHAGVEVLTRNNRLAITLQYGERRWVAFTAPECGRYRIAVNQGYFSVYRKEKEKLQSAGPLAGKFEAEMEKGDTYYFCIEEYGRYTRPLTYTFTAGGTEYTTVAIGDGTKVRGGNIVRFTAPADNYYTFTVRHNGDEVYEESTSLRAGASYTFTVAGDSSEEYTVVVTAREPKETITAGTPVSVSLSEHDEVWYRFTAGQTGRYTFVTENAAKNIEADLFGSLYDQYGQRMGHYESGEGDNASSYNVTADKEMRKGDTVYIRLTSEETNTAVLKVIQAAVVEKDKEQSVTIGADGGTEYVTFEVPRDGEYRFTSSYTKPASLPAEEDVQVAVTVYINNNEVSCINGAGTYECTLSEGDVVRFAVWADRKDTKVTIDVKEISVTKAELDTPTGEIKVSDGVNEWLTFMAANGDGWYNFNFTVQKKADGTVPDATAEFYDADRTAYQGAVSADGSETFRYVEYLEAGTVRMIRLASSDTAEVSVSMKVTKETVDKLEDGVRYTLDPGEIRRLSWTADREGVYHFSGNITPENEITVKYSTDPAREGSTISTLDRISGYMKKGETFYLTLIAADTITAADKKAVFEAAVKGQDVISLTAGETKPVEVGPGLAQWVEFTARKTQRYVYAKADADGFRIFKGSSLEDYDGDEISFDGDEKYTAGQKQLFRVENTNTDKKTIRLTISEVVPVDFVQNQASATMKHGEGKWFRFRAEALGRYQFTAEAKSGDKNAEAVFMKYTADLLDIAEDGLYAPVLDNKIVKAGAYAYLYVEASITDEDTTGDISVTLKAVPVSQVEAGGQLEVNKEKEVTFAAANETKYLEFMAPEDGLYTFTAVKDGESVSGLTVEYYKNLEADLKRGSTEFTLSLEKDDKLIIKLTSAEVQKVQVKVQRETVAKITENAESYSVNDGESLWFSVDSGEALRYFIEAFEAEDGLTLTMERMGGSWKYPVGNQSGNGFYYSYVGSVGGTERLIRITAAVAGDAAESGQSTPKSFKIRKGLVAAETMVSGEAKKIEVTRTEPGHMVWYCFTPEEPGRYVIKAGGESSAYVREFTNGILGSTGSVQSMPYEMIISEAQAGKERTYAVCYTSKEAKDFNFSIYQAAEKNLTEDAPVTVDTAAVEAREKIWIRFKAPADGRYTFTNDSGVELYQRKYQTIDSSYSSGWAFDWDDEICMGEGEEILFAAYYDSVPEKASFSIKVSSVKPEELSVSETPKQIAFSDNSAKWFVFTAPAAAIYQFDMTENDDSADVSVYRYMKLNDQNYDEIYSGQTYGMSAGEKIYFKMQPYGVTDAELTVSIKITSKAAIMKLELADNTIADIAAGVEQWAYFRADETGFYHFAMSGSCKVGRYDDINGGATADYADGESFTYGLYKNEALYFKVSNETEAAAGERITITKEDSEIRDLVAGETDHVTVTDSKTAWYVLTASEAGLYKIAADKGNAILKEYTGLNEQYPVTTKSGSYFRAFDQGETIYLNVSVSSSSETEIAVTCTKLVEKSFTGDGEVKFTLNQGEAAVVRWHADSKGYYNLGYRASQGADYKYYNEEEWNSWKGTGTGYSVSWSEVSVENGESRYWILESGYDRNNISVSAVKTVRQLYVGNATWVELDDSGTETFRFVVNDTGDYVFRSEEGEDVYAYLRDKDGRWLAADTDYSGEDSNFRILYSLAAGTEVRLEVHSGSVSDRFQVGVYRYVQKDVLLDDDCSYTESVTTEYGQEVWFKFTVSKDGFYEFGYGDNYYNVNLKLYATDNDRLGTVLGQKKEYSSNVIKTWLDAGETVMLRSYYNYFEQGTYQVTVRSAEIGAYETSWDISASYGSSQSKYLSFTAGNEAVLSCSFNKSGKYVFYADDEELIFELYVDGAKVDTGSASRIEFEYDAVSDGEKTVELRVHKGRKYQAFSGYVEVSCKYMRGEYALPLTGLEDLSIPYGHEVWLVFQAPASGKDTRYTFTFANTNESNSNVYYAYRYSEPESGSYEARVLFGGYNGVESSAYGVPAGEAETIYWCIRNGKNADLTLTVTVAETSAAPIGEEGINDIFGGGDEKWYAFKAEEAGEYDFAFESDASSYCTVTGYQDLSENNIVSGSSGSFKSSSSFGYRKEFAQGEAIYWKIKYNDADIPATITIRMKKNEDAVLTLGDPEEATAVVYPRLEQWFSFRAEEDARYIFKIRNTNEEDNTSRAASLYAERDTSSDQLDNCMYGSDGGTCEAYIPSGTTVYCYIRNATAYDLSAAVTVEKIPVHEWTEEAVELASGEVKWFSYTAAEEAKYTFTFTSTDRYNPNVVQYSDLNTQEDSVSISQYIVREDGYNYTGETDCFLYANGTVYWKIENTSSTDTRQVKMKAEKVDVTALTSGSTSGNEVAIPAYSTKWVSFTSDHSARYAFTFNASSKVNVYLFTALNAAECKYFDYDGNRANSLILQKKDEEYTGTEDWYIPAGETVYWKVSNSDSTSAAVKVAVEQVEVMEMTADMATDGIGLPSFSTKWIKFTAAESARYMFTLTNSTPGYQAWFYAYLYEDLSQETSIAHVSYYTGESYEYYLEQGESIYWKAPNRNTLMDIATITIKAEPITIEALEPVQGKEISLGADGDSCKWMYFDVEETGIYGITVTNSADSTTEIILDRYEALDSASEDRLGQVASDASATYKYSFSKGMRVYLKAFRNVSPDSASAVGTISVEKIAGAQTLVTGTGKEVSVDTETAKYQWLEFTAVEEGVYKFYSEGSSDPKVWLFDKADINYSRNNYEEPFSSAISDDNSGVDNNFAKKLVMKAGQTVYVLVGSASFSTSLDTTVYVTYVDATGIPVSMEEGKYVLLEYTALTDGNYCFYSDDIVKGDPYAWFFADNAIGNDAALDELDAKRIDYSDDDGEGRNFAKTIPLTAGQTIYIAAGTFQLKSAAAYTVYVERTSAE